MLPVELGQALGGSALGEAGEGCGFSLGAALHDPQVWLPHSLGPVGGEPGDGEPCGFATITDVPCGFLLTQERMVTSFP